MALPPRAVQTVVAVSLLSIVGSLFVVLRLWIRLVVIRAPGYEDYVLIASWLFAIATAGLTYVQVHFGVGSHGNELSQHQNERIGMSLYISIITYCSSIGLTKLAILIQYQRVFSTRAFQIWCRAFIAVVVGFTFSTVVVATFTCWPIEKFWNPHLGGKCINEFASWFSNAGLNIVTDLIIILLPMPMIKSLKLATRQKWLLMGVFALGVMVCVISIVRLHSLFIITHTTDPSYDNAPAATFSIVELNVALICACLPTLRPLLAIWFPALGLTHSQSAAITFGDTGVSHARKRSSVLPGSDRHSLALSNIGGKRSAERLDRESDKIKVVTRVDVRVTEEKNSSGQAE